jgi:flagellar biosynthesis anti-sigma factor FlgM
MKIEVSSPAPSQLPSDRSTKQVSNAGLSATQSATADRTTFHSDGTSVQALTSHALTSPEIRQVKVNAFRQSIGSGEYQVHATSIAGAIIAHEGK